jgi:hypothetical protein
MCNYGIWLARMNRLSGITGTKYRHMGAYGISRAYPDWIYPKNIIIISIRNIVPSDSDSQLETEITVMFQWRGPILESCGRAKVYYKRYWISGIVHRWKRYVRKTKAANVIRNFYFDYIVPRVYNPHTEGKGFNRLKRKLDLINDNYL